MAKRSRRSVKKPRSTKRRGQSKAKRGRTTAKRGKTTAKRRVAKRGRGKKSSKFSNTLVKLKKMKPADLCKALKMSNDAFIKQFCNHVKKLKYATVPPSIEKRMKRQGKKLRKFIHKKTSVKEKRKMLSQRGGFLPLLLAALPALGSVIGGVLSRT